MINDKELEALQDHYQNSMDLCRAWGLDPFEVDFHIAPPEKIYEIASYGIPGHFSHWTFGKSYWLQKMQYDRGWSKIYELVINADPAQAYLLENNSMTENEFVISHVLGHSDFFRRNQYFAHTNRKILHSAEATAERFRDYEFTHGRYVVENFIDDVMTIAEHIDSHLHTKHKTSEYEMAVRSDPFEDLFPERTKEKDLQEFKEKDKRLKIPYEPERDILKFLAGHAPHLDDWQRDVILSIREEMIYFLPQHYTKIGNEGWASLMHRLLMHHLDPESDAGGIQFAQIHSGVLSGRPGMLNPYWLGYNILMRIVQVHGDHSDREMDEFKFLEGPSEGWKKVLEVIEIDNDQSLVMNYLDKFLCEKMDLFGFAFNDPESQWEITAKDWERVRDILASSLTNAGKPYITVEESDYKKKGMLLLKHHHDGRDLKANYARGTLEAMSRIWGRPVVLETKVGELESLIWPDYR